MKKIQRIFKPSEKHIRKIYHSGRYIILNKYDKICIEKKPVNYLHLVYENCELI
jgi:hypothetical protein